MAPSPSSTASDGDMAEALEADLGSADQLDDFCTDRVKSEPDVESSVALHYSHDASTELGDSHDAAEVEARPNQVSVDGHVSAIEQHESVDQIHVEPEDHEPEDHEPHGTDERLDTDGHQVDQAHTISDDHRMAADVHDETDHHIAQDVGDDDNEHMGGDNIDGADEMETVEPTGDEEANCDQTIERVTNEEDHLSEIEAETHVDAEQPREIGDNQDADDHIATDSQIDQMAVGMHVDDEHAVESDPVVNDEHVSDEVQVNVDSAAESDAVHQEQHAPSSDQLFRRDTEQPDVGITSADVATTDVVTGDQEPLQPANDTLPDSENDQQKDSVMEDVVLKPSNSQITSDAAASSATAFAAAAIASTSAATHVAAVPVAPGLPPGTTAFPFPTLGPNGTLMAPSLLPVPVTPVGRRAVKIAPLGMLPLPQPQGGPALVAEATPRIGEIGEVVKGKRRGGAGSSPVGAAVLSGEGMTAEERTKQKRMLRNRESAARSRDKRKSRNIKLQQSIEEHQKKRERLDTEIESLGKVVEVMKQLLEKHNIPVPG